MRIVFVLILIIGFLGTCVAQRICTPTTNFIGTGFYPTSNAIPCAVQGQAYSATLSFRAWTGFRLDSIIIDSIVNLPCGITWVCNRTPNNEYAAGELGCIQLSDSTNDAVGQYNVTVYYQKIVSAFVAGLPYNVNIGTFEDTTIHLRVTSGMGNCAPITNTVGLTSTCGIIHTPEVAPTNNIDAFSAIDEPKLDNLVTLYPNPNNGRFTLTVDQPSKSLAIQLTNIQGQEVYAEQLKDQTSTTKTFDFGSLPKGIYILKVSMDRGSVVKRVVVQ